MTMPMILRNKSIFTEVEINPELSKKNFSSIVLINETIDKNLPIENYRIIPLTDKDSATYLMWDTIMKNNKAAEYLLTPDVLKSLIEGFIPIGLIKLEMNKILSQNKYEGTKLGVGIWTSDKISKHFSVGGFYYRSDQSKDNNYGAGMKYTFSKKTESELRFQWSRCNIATGIFDFMDARTYISMFNFTEYLTDAMDMTNSLKGSFETRFLNYFKANFYYQYSEVAPVFPYPFLQDNTQVFSDIYLHEYGVKLKWAFKEKFIYTFPFGLTSFGTDWPYVWANLSFGNGIQTEKFEYTKLEAQIEKRLLVRESFRTYIRVTGGNIWGDAPSTRLYSLFGFYVNKLSFETPNYFSVMSPNEFAATRFAVAHVRGIYYTRLNKKKFKPEITISTSAGFGDVSKRYSQSVKTFNKGYYESGIYLGNLLKASFFKFGTGVHYRYGPYHLPKEINNWAFVFGVEFGL
jgi:hypothetical protein